MGKTNISEKEARELLKQMQKQSTAYNFGKLLGSFMSLVLMIIVITWGTYFAILGIQALIRLF